ncbi:MAG TPA: ABC transporter substrate-binding protein [Thermomicrobiales bacterium]
MATRDRFEELFREVLAGRLTRRTALGTGAGLSAAAALGPLGAAAAPRGAARSFAARRQDGTPKPGGVLKVGMQADPTALDPHKQSLTAIWHVVEHIYSRLTKILPDLSVGPELAESWEISEDGLVYTFKLRQGVTFHNGRPLVAEDVKYSFERYGSEESVVRSDLASVESVEAPDDSTVVIRLKNRDASILSILASQSAIIIPKEVVEENGDLSQVAVGSGPFIFREYVPNTHVILEKNPNYFEEGLPYLDGLELIIAADDTARTTALVTGTVDMIEYAPLRDIELLQSDPSIVLAGNSNTNIRMVSFNMKREPFNDVRVRQAIAKVIDREAVLGPTVFGHGTTTVVPFPPDYWAALPAEVPAPDIEGARALLAEAGFPDGFKTTITSWAQYSFLSNAAVVIQEQLKQIGIEAELNLVENATMIADVHTNFNYDIAVTGTSAYVDPHEIMINFKTGESGNFVGYSNPQVDELIDQGQAETDQEKRAEIYRQIQQILLDEVPWVCLFVANQYEAMKSYVKGYTHIATGSNYTLRETWLDQ